MRLIDRLTVWSRTSCGLRCNGKPFELAMDTKDDGHWITFSRHGRAFTIEMDELIQTANALKAAHDAAAGAL